MPCGQRCKEILDGTAGIMAAVNKSTECMKNSLILAAVHDIDVPAELLGEFKRCGEAFAASAQVVALAVILPGR